MDLVRLAAHVHGHLAWLAVAALVHPAILLRRPARRASLAVAVAVALVTTAASLGAWLYVAYRARLKPGIFADAEAYGWLFERKEHVAVGAVLLAWTGGLAYAGAVRRGVADATRAHLRRAAWRAFACASALAFAAAVLGTVVAAFRSF